MPPLLAGLLATSVPACSPESAPPVEAPVAAAAGTEPGVCLRVSGLAVRVEEVDRLADDVLELYPEYTRPHARRLAVTNDFLPRLALHAARPEAWAVAREACGALDPTTTLEEPWSQQGTWRDFGLGLWSQARHLAPGTWSEPIEVIGRWLRVRLDERRPLDDVQGEVLRLSIHVFPYLDPSELTPTVEAAIDAGRLEILLPEWGDIVPESWKYRMRDAR